MTLLTPHRLSGLAILAFGAVLLLWIIPAHTETVSYGWMRPQTLPSACAWALIALGAVQALTSGGPERLDAGEAALVFGLAALSAAAIWGFGAVGFLVTAPIFAAALVIFVRERRIGWAVAAILGAPAAIWVIVTLLLNRPLP